MSSRSKSVVALCLLAALTLWGASVSWLNARWLPMYNDLDFRYNEILCSHKGVDPYLVWDRKTTVNGEFVSIFRPDIDSEDEEVVDTGALKVHAYPAWHTTFFWWYAWLPRGVCRWLMILFCCGVFVASFAYMYKNCLPGAMPPGNRAMLVGLCFLASASAWGYQMRVLNYSVLMLLLVLLVVESLRRGHDVLCGLCMALMMIKPHIALLFFWPMLFAGRYKAILTAAVVCSLAVLWPAYVYGCSPIDLVAEIFKIGGPYVLRYKQPIFRLARLVFGQEHAIVGQMAAGFVACGVLSWLMRGARSWFLRFLPAMVIFPLWSYIKTYDFVMEACWCFVIGVIAAHCGREEPLRRYGWMFRWSFAAFLAASVLQIAFDTMTYFGCIADDWRLLHKSVFFVASLSAVAVTAVATRIVPLLNASLVELGDLRVRR